MITVTIGSHAVRAGLARLSALTRDLTPVFRSMGTTLKSITEGTFNSAGASYRPQPWAPKKSGGASNLQRSTTLAKSFQLSAGPREAVVTATPVYAAIHQFGFSGRQPVKEHRRRITTAFGRQLKFPVWSTVRAHSREFNMPARPFFPLAGEGLTPAAERLIVRAGERAVQGVVDAQPDAGMV